MASNAENGSIWWRHHELNRCDSSWWALINFYSVSMTSTNTIDYITYWVKHKMTYHSGKSFYPFFSIKFYISLKFHRNVFQSKIYHKQAFAKTMTWHRTGDKPLYEAMIARHIFSSAADKVGGVYPMQSRPPVRSASTFFPNRILFHLLISHHSCFTCLLGVLLCICQWFAPNAIFVGLQLRLLRSLLCHQVSSLSLSLPTNVMKYCVN